MSQRAYDEQGLLYVEFQRLPGQESNPLYLPLQTQIAQYFPRSIDFGLTRLPVAGELLKVDRFLWLVKQVIHHPVDLTRHPDDLFPELPSMVAIVQVGFYGVLG